MEPFAAAVDAAATLARLTGRDFHDVAVWQVEAALKAAFDAGSRSATNNSKSHDATRIDREGSMTARHSPAPWSFEYSPYRFHRGEDGIESELPAFEVFDAEGPRNNNLDNLLLWQLQEYAITAVCKMQH